MWDTNTQLLTKSIHKYLLRMKLITTDLNEPLFTPVENKGLKNEENNAHNLIQFMFPKLKKLIISIPYCVLVQSMSYPLLHLPAFNTHFTTRSGLVITRDIAESQTASMRLARVPLLSGQPALHAQVWSQSVVVNAGHWGEDKLPFSQMLNPMSLWEFTVKDV